MAWKPDYITTAELRDYLKRDDPGDVDEDLLADWAATASRAVDGATGRQFGAAGTAQTRTYPTTWDPTTRRYVAIIDDLYGVDGLICTVNGTAVDVDDLQWWPRNALLNGMVYERVSVAAYGDVQMTTETWGWPTVPRPVKVATRLQAARLAFRQEAPHGIAGSPEEGSEQRLLAVLDPDLKTSLRPYVRKWWAA